MLRFIVVGIIVTLFLDYMLGDFVSVMAIWKQEIVYAIASSGMVAPISITAVLVALGLPFFRTINNLYR